jgi:multidrug efflux pump subunit AcrA (membrane-fusion protein)
MLMLKVLATLLIAGQLPSAEVRANPSRAVVQHCQVFLIDDVDVPAQESGPLVGVKVQEGQIVRQSELLAQIDDKESQLLKLSAEAERDAAQAKADDDIDVRYAFKSHEVAEAELNQDLDIKRRTPGAVSDAEVRRKQLVVTREKLGIDRAKLEQQIAQLTAQVKNSSAQSADNNILRRRIVAPFDGMVVDVYKQASEWVNAGEPVLRVVRMDRLRVDGFLSGDDYNPVDVSQRPVTVEIQLAQNRRESFTGQVVFVNPLVQAGNKYRIRAVVENRFERNEPLLRPGMTAQMMIHLK